MSVAHERLAWTPSLVRLTAGLMLSIFVAAMDSTVVGTALPTIARELGQFQLYPWVFSAYLITATTSVPVWGKLADLRGRRPMLLTGTAIFIAGSLACGMSPGMGWLIAFRALQGVGAGCIQPLVFTVVGDVFPMQQRARMQGLFSSMWAVAALIGPTVGAAFVSTIGWRWIFVINLPVGLVSAALIWAYRERRPAGVRGELDVVGAILLTGGIALLLWGLGAGSPTATPTWPAVGVAAVTLAAFGAVEARRRAPLLPLDLLRHPVVGPAVFVALVGGVVMFGVTAYVPLFVQQVLGGSAFAAGAAVAAMSIGWPVTSAVAGFIMVRVGYQRLVVAGGLMLVAGTVLLAVSPTGPGIVAVTAGSLIVGCGMGAFTAPLLIVIQSSVDWGRRGAATALNQFARTIGGAMGVSLLGILLQAFVGGSHNPLAARRALESGLRADFEVLVGASLVVLATSVAMILARPHAEIPARGAEAASRTEPG